jgi:hypothetical protein
MLRTTTERAVAGLAVLLGLGLLPVLPAGVPVLVAALAAPIALVAEGRSKGRGRQGVRRGRARPGGPAGHTGSDGVDRVDRVDQVDRINEVDGSDGGAAAEEDR